MINTVSIIGGVFLLVIIGMFGFGFWMVSRLEDDIAEVN